MFANTKTDQPVNTAALPPNSSRLQRLLQAQSERDARTAISSQVEIVFVIRGVPEYLTFRQSTTLILGRNVFGDFTDEGEVDFDLEPYGASQRGVSRRHVRLDLLSDRYLYITDLHSTNGTYLNGARLKPYVPSLLDSGDKLVLGRLPIQIFFEQHPSLAAL